jgi:hypothetical protein
VSENKNNADFERMRTVEHTGTLEHSATTHGKQALPYPTSIATFLTQ